MSEGDQTMEKSASNQSPPRRFRINPPWLVPPALADLDERMEMLLKEWSYEEEEAGDSFGERAEWYFQKRPHLLSLLKDLYNGYITLLESSQRKQCKHHPSQISITTVHHKTHDNDEEEEDGGASQIDSDSESSTLSYQQPPSKFTQHHCNNIIITNVDEMVADLVMKNVENDILLDRLSELESESESSRKIELLKNLIEVLESERIILLNENMRLGYKVNTLLEENKGLESEATFMRRKAGELARCVLRMREDHRVFIMSQKIEDLQGQIYGLEKRNKEYYEQLVVVNEEKRSWNVKEKKKKKNGGASHVVVSFGSCLPTIEKNKSKKRDDTEGSCGSNGGCDASDGGSSSSGEKRLVKWWERMKNMDLFMCGLHPNST